MGFCVKCGAQLSPGGRYCTACGAKLETESTAPISEREPKEYVTRKGRRAKLAFYPIGLASGILLVIGFTLSFVAGPLLDYTLSQSLRADVEFLLHLELSSVFESFGFAVGAALVIAGLIGVAHIIVGALLAFFGRTGGGTAIRGAFICTAVVVAAGILQDFSLGETLSWLRTGCYLIWVAAIGTLFAQRYAVRI